MLRPTSALSSHDRQWLGSFLRDKPLFRLYFEAALADLENGIDNRSAYLGQDRAGALLGIAFDQLVVVTAIGTLRPDELALGLASPSATELHLEPAHEAILRSRYGHRLIEARDMHVYGRKLGAEAADPDARRLGADDAHAVTRFMQTHYPRNAFSEWMLTLPFVALFHAGDIVATAGTIACHGDTALIGDFLTRPDQRGRGYARRLAHHLGWVFAQEGVRTLVLATTADNVPACRAYEAAGFRILETRRQIDLGPKNV
ncbi:GNAT family N-acetyltransferase [Microvirga alba]|uniref:GNAT family N-acetyltransferase n=1 Tax=Microvirga alba TaxID=2791025 RepID=A0A931BW45_9HYPH|nr:GNAT family N-acetyltransferase [Microvirga alba]MBF9234940.1 GNAT family N-acetyltransferase [Microvirga alba]